MKGIIPREEYPRPDFVRNNWQNLNGEWEFYNDLCASGEERKAFDWEKFPEKIIVPFCPESELSGIGFKDFMPSVWYAKNVEIAKERLKGRVLLHIGACDYQTCVYVNGQKAGAHVGGYTPFSIDVTQFLNEGTNRIVIHALDDVRSRKQPSGKQSRKFASYGCLYTRTTGIWQTVWIEFVETAYLQKVKINATDLGGLVLLESTLNEYFSDAELSVTVRFAGEVVAQEKFPLCGKTNAHALRVSKIFLWNTGEPNLYDISYRLSVNGVHMDEVNGYFGIRRIDLDGYKVRINGRSVFQRLVLDQGFYPDGIYTARSDEELLNDIRRSMRFGFNGARLHQKVFEPRFLYHADKEGYLVWGEHANWGLDVSVPDALHAFLPEWLEAVERDYNHPSIIGWCPYNETHNEVWRDYTNNAGNVAPVYRATKAVDSTRPVIDTSGWYHTDKTDIFDVHNYEQNVAAFTELFQNHGAGKWFANFPRFCPYDGKSPYMVSEYGGIKWTGEQENGKGWGYGNAPKTREEFVERYCGLANAILSQKNIMGLCYTQLTDVEQEQNGLYFYDRTDKFTAEEIACMRAAITKTAEIEKE